MEHLTGCNLFTRWQQSALVRHMLAAMWHVDDDVKIKAAYISLNGCSYTVASLALFFSEISYASTAKAVAVNPV